MTLPGAHKFDGILKLPVLVSLCCLPSEFNQFVGLKLSGLDSGKKI